jgi:hypothetical protein
MTATGSEASRPAGPDTEAADREQAEAAEKRLRSGHITFGDLVRLKYWQTREDAEFAARRSLGARITDEAQTKFVAKNGGDALRLSLFGEAGVGACLKPDGDLTYVILEKAIRFDWTDALLQLHRIDAIAEDAQEFWGTGLVTHERKELDKAEVETESAPKKVFLPRRREERARQSAKERQALLESAYGTCTAILSAINLENEEHGAGARRSEEPKGAFTKRIALLARDLDRNILKLELAAQRNAQVNYGRGMLRGAVALTIVCIVIGAALWIGRAPAWYMVALPAGGLGAIVSVLQRMAKGNLRLDVHAGREMLAIFGAVRPLIGGVFGIALFAGLEAELFQAIQVTTTAPLAFYAIIGFLAGFNERFAQDMLAGPAGQLATSAPAGTPAAPAASAVTEK